MKGISLGEIAWTNILLRHRVLSGLNGDGGGFSGFVPLRAFVKHSLSSAA
jgi:hypothetical protein